MVSGVAAVLAHSRAGDAAAGAVDDRPGDELVAVDPAVDDEAGGDHRIPAAAGREVLGQQGYLEAAGHLIHRHFRGVPAAGLPCGKEALAAAIDDVAVPAGLDEGDAQRRAAGCTGEGRVVNDGGGGTLIHGRFLFEGCQDQGDGTDDAGAQDARRIRFRSLPSGL